MKTQKKALILGINGQDGAYLAQLLINHGYQVSGTSRDAQVNSFEKLIYLGIREQVCLFSMAANDFRSVLETITKVMPDEIYNLAGQTSVGLSFEQPVQAFESIAVANINLLEVIRFLGRPIKLYNACSSECFGNTIDYIADEETPFHPRSPYAVAKAAAFWEVANYREAYGLYVCSGILFNHESPLRPERFVTQKIISGACRIARGSKEKLQLGNVEIQRDWGWAPEYVEAMWLILQQDKPEDYVIATAETHSLKEFVKEAFLIFNLNWHDHTESLLALLRPTDILVSKGNPAKAKNQLNWQARSKMKDVVRMMVEAKTLCL
jgi:GDPmannose 4,6-dehydratase